MQCIFMYFRHVYLLPHTCVHAYVHTWNDCARKLFWEFSNCARVLNVRVYACAYTLPGPSSTVCSGSTVIIYWSVYVCVSICVSVCVFARVHTFSSTTQICFLNISLTPSPTHSDEHKMLREMCRTFADAELAPNAGKWDKAHKFPTEVIKQMGEMGLMGVAQPTDYGGAGCVATCDMA